MPKRLVKKGVTIVREGKRVRPEVGKGFDFTADEIERITEVDPAALGSAKEATAAEDGEAETASTTTTSSAEGSQAGAKGGKKAATANKSDAEAKKSDDDL